MPPSTIRIASRVGNVFLFQDARRQRMIVVRVENRHGLLQNDGAVVEVSIHEMHGAAGDFHSVVEGLFLRVESGKAGSSDG